MSINFSPVQNSILSKLKNAKSLRYSQLQPKKMPNDLFNYHLQFLVKKGFLNKKDDGYTLSPSGVKHMADPYPTTAAPQITSLFKVNVLTVVSRVHDGKIQILNQLRKSNPSYGKVGVMGGVVLKGESIEDAATRKLKIETGLEAKFKLVGIHRRMMYVKDELFSDVYFPIAYASKSAGELVRETEYGENMWVDISKAIKNESAEFDSITSLIPVLKAIKNGKIKKLPFFFKEHIQRGDFK
jgi:ADP-ribose pyrophosphatase YjhB (NUDIX family)